MSEMLSVVSAAPIPVLQYIALVPLN